MANDIQKSIVSNDIKNGTIVVSTKPTGPAAEDKINTYVSNKPVIADIEAKYDDKFDDITRAEQSCPVNVIEVLREAHSEQSSTHQAKTLSKSFPSLRALHFYSSILGSLLFLFFAFTGLLANRPELISSTHPQAIPANIKFEKQELTVGLKHSFQLFAHYKIIALMNKIFT